jgi:hypothetical protein
MGYAGNRCVAQAWLMAGGMFSAVLTSLLLQEVFSIAATLENYPFV